VAVVAPPPLGDGYDLQLVAQNRAHVPHVNHSAAQKVVDLAEAAQARARANANEAHRLELAILKLAQVTPEILEQRKRTAARKKQNEIHWHWLPREGEPKEVPREVVVVVRCISCCGRKHGLAAVPLLRPACFTWVFPVLCTRARRCTRTNRSTSVSRSTGRMAWWCGTGWACCAR